MKKIVKQIIILAVVLCVAVSSLVMTVSAASSSIAFSKSSIAIGETLTVTATFSNNSAMYGLEGYITYDPDVLQFVSGENCNKLIDGKVKIVMQSAAKTSLKETIQFKALAAGSCKISLESLLYVDSNDVEQTLSGSAATVTVTNPSASASSNANLTNLRVSAGTLSPAFSKDVTTYSVTIPNDVTELLVNVSTEDRKATATVEGSKDMKVGQNKRVVVITAENGNQKRYTLNITRLDASGEVPDTPDIPDEEEKTEVVADGQTMYIDENFSPDIVPEGFNVDIYVLSGEEVPCITDNNVVMLYLIMPDGSGGGFFVINEDGSFSKMTVINVGGINYYVIPAEEKDIPVGYTKTEITVGEQTVTAYKGEDATLSDFVLIYAKGPSSYTGLYRFDTAEMTMQRAVGIDLVYQDELEEEIPSGDILANINNLSTNGKIVAITIVAIILLLVAAIIVLIVKIASSSKRKEEDEEELDDSDLIGFDFVTMEDRDEK